MSKQGDERLAWRLSVNGGAKSGQRGDGVDGPYAASCAKLGAAEALSERSRPP